MSLSVGNFFIFKMDRLLIKIMKDSVRLKDEETELEFPSNHLVNIYITNIN